MSGEVEHKEAPARRRTLAHGRSGSASAGELLPAAHSLLNLQRLLGNQAVSQLILTGSGTRALQRQFLEKGAKLEKDFDYKYSPPNSTSTFTVISMYKRHTIRGFVSGGAATKDLNTLLLIPVEMTKVAADAYAFAWKPDKSRLNVADGASFDSQGVTWGITTSPTDNLIHIYPLSGSANTIDISGLEKGPLGTFLTYGGKEDPYEFALTLLHKRGGDKAKFDRCVKALIDLGEVRPKAVAASATPRPTVPTTDAGNTKTESKQPEKDPVGA
jgi:hypothetical protein